MVENLRYRTTLPEGPDVELHEVQPTRTARKVEEIVSRWVKDGFCSLDDILILSPYGTKAKTSLANHSRIGEWAVAGIDRRKPDNLALLSVNKAKGLDSLAVIMIDVERLDKPATPQEQVNYFVERAGRANCSRSYTKLNHETFLRGDPILAAKPWKRCVLLADRVDVEKDALRN